MGWEKLLRLGNINGVLMKSLPNLTKTFVSELRIKPFQSFRDE
jgi:hypothetical protein